MNQFLQNEIVEIMRDAKDMTLATVRPDGFPQATTVSYANDGTIIYAGIGKASQKAENIRQCDKVSLTINLPYTDWMHIKGLSMAAHAEILQAPAEIAHAVACLRGRYPQLNQWVPTNLAEDIALLKIVPQLVTVLDYQKGFGHTEQVSV